MHLSMITSYDNMPIKAYRRFIELVSGEYDWKDILEIITEKPLDDVLISEMNNLSAEFLKSPYKAKMPFKQYKIGDREYEVELNPNKMSVSQFIDFQTFIKEPDKYMANLLACFLIPKGEKYGDSDPLENAEYLNENCSIAICMDINFFFEKLFQTYVRDTQDSLERHLKSQIRMEKDPNLKKILLKKLINLKLHLVE